MPNASATSCRPLLQERPSTSCSVLSISNFPPIPHRNIQHHSNCWTHPSPQPSPPLMIRRSDIHQHTKYVSAPAADSGNHHQLRSLSSSSRLLPRCGRDETSCLPRPDLLVSSCSWFWRSTRSNPNPRACSRRSRSQPHWPSLHRRWFRRFHVSGPSRTRASTKPRAVTRDDDLKLRHAWIASVVRCAPPGDKPLPQEIRNCGTHLARRSRLFPVYVLSCVSER